MLIYKLKSNKTGLFSTGGTCPTFSKQGKIWRNIGHLRNHINQLGRGGQATYANNDVVMVAYEVIEIEVETKTFHELVAESNDKKSQREAARKNKIEQWQKEQRRKEYERLHQEFGCES